MADPVSTLSERFDDLSLAEVGAMLAAQKLPPVERWNPPDRGDSFMESGRRSWWHKGGQIGRPALVKLFASILRREADGSYALVTPYEKQRIAVADLPFRAVEMLSEGAGCERRLVFRLDTGEVVAAGAEHPLRFGGSSDQPRPAVHVRGAIGNGLEARLSRALYYDIAELALAEGEDPPAIWSDGERFALTA
ncbi:MAG: DUF1285 domain-containing protein [Sphingopyxis sp.]|nr:DUF1285 domain-containing protein [Sphingopyxis sp.]